MATRTPLLDYYEVLGLHRDAAPAEIEAAFKAEMLKVRDLPGSGERTRRIGLAYRALSNPDRRRDYDAALSGAPGPDGGNVPEPEDWPARMPDSEATAAPAFFEDERERMEPRRSHRPAFLLVLAAAALLLLAGLWAGGLFGTDPKIAEVAPNNGLPAGSGAASNGSAATGDDEGLGRFGSLIAPVAEEPGPANAQAPSASSTVTSSIPTPSDPTEEGAAVVEAPGEAVATTNEAAPVGAEPQPDLPPAPAPEPARQSPPPPPPTPAVDRSAGARLIGGGLRDSDNQGGRFQGTVGVRLTVGTNGRAQGCSVTRSSGNAALDSTTCRLLQERLQFNPARNREGNPVVTEVESTHVWGRQRRR
jgi:protein TonB